MRIALLVASILVMSPAFASSLIDEFQNPPRSARPGVYWYFMDGNQNRDEMVKDLESMDEAGLGNLVFLEVNVGVPRGPVDFMSEQWQSNYVHAVRHAERLGIDITLGVGPGWSGSGGPWVQHGEAMQHLLFSTVEVTGPSIFEGVLELPPQIETRWHKKKSPFSEDVITYAIPRSEPTISDIEEKALYTRNPYTLSGNTMRPYYPQSANYPDTKPDDLVEIEEIIDLTDKVDENGHLKWKVPAGEWTVIRMVRRPTGASTRPAPKPADGFEHDKFSKAALENHFENYYGALMEKVGRRNGPHGWTTVHLDSWEMGAQNWTPGICEEFTKRCGYDPSPYLITFTGRVVGSREQSERFLFDWRMVCQQLVLENYVGHLKQLGHENGFDLSIEPYDMSPVNDINLGAVADTPMCEFWSKGMGHDSVYGCLEAVSASHITGKSIVPAEAFTARNPNYRQYPWSMKNQGDWAFAFGINRFVYHTYPHKPLGDEYAPGMPMGPYGVHWDRKRIWWPMVADYHTYVSRCSHLLRQGVAVADILYLTPEGAPHVFTPPKSAFHEFSYLRDKKGYQFDGCSPELLRRASVKDGLIVFKGGTQYRILVLPDSQTMTPEHLETIMELLKAGATVVGTPLASPSLVGYPQCDAAVVELAESLWGSLGIPEGIHSRQIGKGMLFYGKDLTPAPISSLDEATRSEFTNESIPTYPEYVVTASILKGSGTPEDFSATPDAIRFNHRRNDVSDIYFVSNRENERVEVQCSFRVTEGEPVLLDPVTGDVRALPEFTRANGVTQVYLSFEAFQSYFVVFSDEWAEPLTRRNFPMAQAIMELDGAWDVAFDPKMGGPESIEFSELADWTQHDERGIKYYSGIASYTKTFEAPDRGDGPVYLDLGEVHDMARVTLNGYDLGVVWCAPWRIEITDTLKAGTNKLQVDVANRWVNRLIGDNTPPDKGVRTVQFAEGYLEGKEYKAGRFTFSLVRIPESQELLPSGLLGPVQITTSE